MSAIILVDPATGRQERFEKRHLPVFVQVGVRIRDHLGEILAESSEVRSEPLLVDVTTTRFLLASRLMNGPLAEAQLMMTTGLFTGASHSESSRSVTSGPRGLNLASRPS